MKFLATNFADAWIIESEPVADERGFFTRTFCTRAFAERGLATTFVQHSVSVSKAKGTLRGLHFQRAPHAEVKVVRCHKGRIFDVIVDLRPASPAFKRWQGFELSAETRRALYIPEGFAHGFQSLEDGVEVGYLISAFYEASAAAGVHHADPAFAIDWPLPVTAISGKDKSWPAFVA